MTIKVMNKMEDFKKVKSAIDKAIKEALVSFYDSGMVIKAIDSVS